jgi:hypothetical protein
MRVMSVPVVLGLADKTATVEFTPQMTRLSVAVTRSKINCVPMGPDTGSPSTPSSLKPRFLVRLR